MVLVAELDESRKIDTAPKFLMVAQSHDKFLEGVDSLVDELLFEASTVGLLWNGRNLIM